MSKFSSVHLKKFLCPTCTCQIKFPNATLGEFFCAPSCCLALPPVHGLTQWRLSAKVIFIFVRQKCEENIATVVAVTRHLPFHCFHVPPPEKVPMVYSVTPATASAATSPATSVPYAATAPANQVCSSLQLSVINPSALNKCSIFQSGLASSPQHGPAFTASSFLCSQSFNRARQFITLFP